MSVSDVWRISKFSNSTGSDSHTVTSFPVNKWSLELFVSRTFYRETPLHRRKQDFFFTGLNRSRAFRYFVLENSDRISNHVPQRAHCLSSSVWNPYSWNTVGEFVAQTSPCVLKYILTYSPTPFPPSVSMNARLESLYSQGRHFPAQKPELGPQNIPQLVSQIDRASLRTYVIP